MHAQAIQRFTVVAAVTTALLSAQLLARTANQLSDLVGARASSGETQLQARGFTFITGRTVDAFTKRSYWWHTADKNCIRVDTNDGRYNSIVDVTKSDCNQGDGNAAGAVAAVAGIALIAALIAHKSDHHDDGKHYDDPQREADYDRGFNDGLHNASYHNYSRSDAYGDGYGAGVAQRNANLQYRDNGSPRGGYGAYVDFNDLKGARAAGADTTLRDRGFANVDSFSSGNAAYTIWNRQGSHQCVQMTVSDGRVYDIRDIGTHPRCR